MLRRQLLNNLSFTVPKNRKPKFDLTLKIIDLNNIPLGCGTTYVKWHLPSSTSAEHRGRTDKAIIREHKATWDYTKELSVRFIIDKNLALQECEIYFEVLQEYHDGGRGRVVLGHVKLNLAEYVDRPDVTDRESEIEQEEDGGITRRYLMQESKINSTLKIGIVMKQTEGDTNFIPPPLKSAMVFGGIAGIVAGEGGEGDNIPTISSKTRELSELQDVYRRTLAATWACQAGELPPDKLVEDLFAGGDGGRMNPPPNLGRGYNHHTPMVPSRDESVGSSTSDTESRRTITSLTPDAARNGHRRYGSRGNGSSMDGWDSPQMNGALGGGVSGRSGVEQQLLHTHSHKDHHRRRSPGKHKEVTEFEVREDLRSWQIKTR